MLDNARIVYEDRVADVDRYVDFLRVLVLSKPLLQYVRSDGGELSQPIDIELTHTLKATAFLLLYNLVEATIRRALSDSREHIENAGFQHHDLHENLRNHITEQLKYDDIRGRVKGSIHPLGRAILWAGFDADKALGGNLDHESIVKTARKFGFSVITNAEITRGGQSLKDIKRNRNILAHGNKSFLECGRDTAIEEIIQITGEVEAYLAQILDNIEAWLSNRAYLAIPPVTIPTEA